ncbi:hypothetical protein CXZ10_20400 [Pleomorphomonas diazotrophica]|uniref:Uncharacterized protein n=1 Tax=Pleomorphomonas diazotrophica TaxID=1166257 RepID=A0A1I4V662_9HYPH|nr:hypothetical protein [Pleomorphomonas diazotrophica]PKR87408.1 hypothetical protein CXZ10_20400 [Pleomorphomonas diazotrophica]SFM96662.1 hypothetical protein SAMN05192571_110103 [Pleomorphomonas diazotrophica]
MRTPDSPENYNAYKDRQRQQDEKRQTFRVATQLGDHTSSPVSDGQLAEQAAKATGSKPAPEDMVRANHELFREADNKAWAEKIGKEAPITLAVAGDPKNVSRPREYYDALASLEQVTGKLVAASQAFPDGTARARGRLNSPSIPNTDFVDEFAAVRQQVNEQSGGHPAPSGGQGNSNGLRLGEKVINVEVVPDTDVTASSPRSDSAADPTSDSAQSGSSSADSQNSTSSTEASAGRGPNGGLRPGENVINVEVVPESRTNSTNGTAASTPLSGDVWAKTPPYGTGEQSVMPVGTGSEKASAIGSSLPFGSDPSIPNVTTFEMPRIKLPDAPSAGASLALGIAGLGKNPGYWVVAAYRDLIDKQSDIPKDRALGVLDGVVTGNLTREQALAKLTAGPSAAGQAGDSAIAAADGGSWDDDSPLDSYAFLGSPALSVPLWPIPEMPEIELPKDAPSERAALALGIASLGKNPDYMVVAAFRELIAKQPDIPQERAIRALNGVADGSLTQEQALEMLNYIPSREQEKLADEVANSVGLTEDEAKDLEEWLKSQPYIPVDRALEVFHSVRRMKYGPTEAKNLLMATTDEELASLAERMVHAKGKSPEEIAAIRRGIYGQNSVDSLISDHYFRKFLNGDLTEDQLLKIMTRHGVIGSIVEFAKRIPTWQAKSVGNIIKFLDYYIAMPETKEWKNYKALIQEVLNLKGKSQSEFDEVYQRILNTPNPGSLIEAWNAMKEGEDPEEVGKMFPSYPLGDGAIAYGNEFVTPGWENSTAGRLGEATGSLINAAAFGWLAPLYAGLDGAAANHAKAVENGADAETTRNSDALAGFLGLFTSLPLEKALMRFTPLKKYAGGAVDDIVGLGTNVGMSVVQQGGQNAIAKWGYDKNRALFQDAGTAAAAGALLSGLKIGGGIVFRKAVAGVDSYSARKAVSEAQEAVRRDGVLRDMEDLLEQKVSVVVNNRTEIYDFVQQKVKGTPRETLYFRIDNFENSLVKAGIDPKTFVESLGGVTLGDFRKAAKAGGYVRVPLATFVAYVMRTNASKPLLEHATFRPGITTPANAADFLKNLANTQPKGTVADPPEEKPAPTDTSATAKASPP